MWIGGPLGSGTGKEIDYCMHQGDHEDYPARATGEESLDHGNQTQGARSSTSWPNGQYCVMKAIDFECPFPLMEGQSLSCCNPYNRDVIIITAKAAM